MFFFNLRFSSSLPNRPVIKLTGVINPKKINPKTIGLMIMPNNKPNFIHKLFKGCKIPGLINVIIIKIIPNEASKDAKIIFSIKNK